MPRDVSIIHGPNELGEDEGSSWWRTLLNQFRNPLIYILIIAALVTSLLGHYADTGAISADLRLLSTTNLQFDESLLAGESVPVDQDPKPVDGDQPLAERSSMAYNGSSVASGPVVAVVVATGERTELGSIAEQMRPA